MKLALRIPKLGVALWVIGSVCLIAGQAFPRGGPEKPILAATIYPLYDIARNVAGNHAEVKVILPPGASPHLFEFSPRQLSALQHVQAVFAIGHGLDNWVRQVTNVTQGARVIVVDHQLDLSLEKEQELREQLNK